MSATLGLLGGCESPDTLSVTPVTNPAPENARLPNVTRKGDALVLNWVETQTSSRVDDSFPEDSASSSTTTNTLNASIYRANSGWSKPTTIAQGAHWFVNWADFPSVYAVSDQHMAAHWLRRSGQSTYAYDVVTSQTTDGTHWSAPRIPHMDGTKTEHGFVSFFTMNNRAALAWLDGRLTNSTGGGHADHGSADATSAMTLRTRILDTPQEPSEIESSDPARELRTDKSDDIEPIEPLSSTPFNAPSTLLDGRVCDCCQTTAVNTDAGALVFYRDRSEDEVRDIAYVRYDQAQQNWSSPKRVHEDGWQITGCPVNGPQAAASNNFVAIAWYTAAPSPRVQIATSTNAGLSFDRHLVLSDAAPIGRVSVVILANSDQSDRLNEEVSDNDRRILVSWLQSLGSDAVLMTALLDESLGVIDSTEVASISAKRSSGFPRMAAISYGSALITWTDWVGETSSVHTAQIDVR